MHDSILNSKQVFQFDIHTQTQQIRVRLGTELTAVIDCIRHMTQKKRIGKTFSARECAHACYVSLLAFIAVLQFINRFKDLDMHFIQLEFI